MAQRAEDFTRYFVARRDPVRRTAYLLCGDWCWADDLTQVAFVRLAAAWDRVRDPVRPTRTPGWSTAVATSPPTPTACTCR